MGSRDQDSDDGAQGLGLRSARRDVVKKDQEWGVGAEIEDKVLAPGPRVGIGSEVLG